MNQKLLKKVKDQDIETSIKQGLMDEYDKRMKEVKKEILERKVKHWQDEVKI